MKTKTKETKRHILTDHLDIIVVTETIEPEPYDADKAAERVEVGGDPQAELVRAMGGMMQHAQAAQLGRVKKHILIRKTGMNAGEHARVEPDEASLLIHLLQGITNPFAP